LSLSDCPPAVTVFSVIASSRPWRPQSPTWLAATAAAPTNRRRLKPVPPDAVSDCCDLPFSNPILPKPSAFLESRVIVSSVAENTPVTTPDIPMRLSNSAWREDTNANLDGPNSAHAPQGKHRPCSDLQHGNDPVTVDRRK